MGRTPRKSHSEREGIVVGLAAGLIPCPLTLFVMTFAISRGVAEAGILFAPGMMLGVALTLSTVVVTVVLFRRQLMHMFEAWPKLFLG